MALPSCRASFLRGKTLTCVLSSPSISAASSSPSPSSSLSSITSRSYVSRPHTSDTPVDPSQTPETFKISESQADNVLTVPRWMETPKGMKAPFPMDFAKNAVNKIWVVNNDPAALDAMYNKLLGPGGSKMLPEEVKWLAVTHKSFDQGRRGFNDRLALMGRMTLVHEAVKDTVGRRPLEGTQLPDNYDREPFQHEQLDSVDNLLVRPPKQVISKAKLHALASSVGLVDVMRWKPRMTQELELSGVQIVANGAIYAIVGAILLQHGAAVASKVVTERILAKLPNST